MVDQRGRAPLFTPAGGEVVGVWALTFECDGDVRQRPRERGSFGDRLNKEKRGLSVKDLQKLGGIGEDFKN